MKIVMKDDTKRCQASDHFRDACALVRSPVCRLRSPYGEPAEPCPLLFFAMRSALCPLRIFSFLWLIFS
ncbi:MAG: hypothetical protein P8184_17530 [Calditrichia bacterium]